MLKLGRRGYTAQTGLHTALFPSFLFKRAADSTSYLKGNEKSKHLESSNVGNHVDPTMRADQAVFGNSLGALGNNLFTHLIIASMLHVYFCKHHSSAICMC